MYGKFDWGNKKLVKVEYTSNIKISEGQIYRYMVYSTRVIKQLVQVEYTSIIMVYPTSMWYVRSWLKKKRWSNTPVCGTLDRGNMKFSESQIYRCMVYSTRVIKKFVNL